MKKFIGILAVMLLMATVGKAQDEPKEKPKRVVIPVRVQIQLTELDGDKKVAVLPYSFLGQAEKKDFPGFDNALRVGVRFPAPDKDGKPSYVDIGSNIDCGISAKDDGLFEVRINFERSALYGAKKGQDTITSADASAPIIPTMRTASMILLKDGQTSQLVSAADPLNGHIFHIDVTLTVQK